MTTTVRRDLVVIGCSAGCVRALPIVLDSLPAGLPAAVVVVQHLLSGSELVEIVQRRTKLPVAWAEQGDSVVPGRVYIAPADAHLLLVDDHLRLDGGPRENHVRPSIDRAFRSAAARYGARTIGVIMTGMLDDGVIGLAAIRACGGYAIIEDPNTAAYPELPGQALAQAGADAVLPVAGIGPAILAALAEPAVPREIPRELVLEAELDGGPSEPATLDLLGARSPMPCPECSGPLWQAGDAQTRHFRCYLGHAANPRGMLSSSHNELERAMWTAIRTLHDRAALFDTLRNDAETAGNRVAATAYGERARDAVTSAETARRFMLELGARHK